MVFHATSDWQPRKLCWLLINAHQSQSNVSLSVWGELSKRTFILKSSKPRLPLSEFDSCRKTGFFLFQQIFHYRWNWPSLMHFLFWDPNFSSYLVRVQPQGHLSTRITPLVLQVIHCQPNARPEWNTPKPLCWKYYLIWLLCSVQIWSI